MRWILFRTLLLGILLIHCGPSKHDADSSLIILKENPRFIDLNPIKEKSIFIENIDFPRIYLDGSSVIVDGPSLGSRSQYHFYTFDKDLNLLKDRRFNIGQGPGELGGGPYFFPVGDKIYVPDNTQMRINIFDRDFNFIKFVKVSYGFNSPVFSKDGTFFIYVIWSPGKYGPTSYFSVYAATFPGLKRTLIHAFPEFDLLLEEKKQIFLDRGGIHYFLKGDKIYLLDKDNYVLTIRNTAGKIEKQVRVDTGKIHTPRNMEDTWLEEHMGINPHLFHLSRKWKLRLGEYIQPCAWMIPLEKGFAVIRKSGYSGVCQGLVDADYFDYRLNLLGKVKFPCFSEIFHLRQQIFLQYCDVAEGMLYLVNSVKRENDDVITLEKWRISE